MDKQSSPTLATLDIVYLRRPHKTAKERAEADKLNAEFGAKDMFCRTVYDWGFTTYTEEDESVPQPFKSGDLVKIFKTISDGDVLWSDRVDFSYTEYHHGLQKNLDKEAWIRMFYQKLPVKLQRRNQTFFGALEPFSETGTQGQIWSISEYGKGGYEGLIHLDNGDQLTVYKSVSVGEIEWEGPVEFGPEKESKLLKVFEIARKTKHMESRQWLEMSFQRRPVIVEPK